MKRLNPVLLKRMENVTEESIEARRKESKVEESKLKEIAPRKRPPRSKSKIPKEIKKNEPTKHTIFKKKELTVALIETEQKESKVGKSTFRRRTPPLKLKKSKEIISPALSKPKIITAKLIEPKQKESKVGKSTFRRCTLLLKIKRPEKVTDESIEVIRKENMIEFEESTSCRCTLRLRLKVRRKNLIKAEKEEKMKVIKANASRKSTRSSDVIVCELNEKDDAMVQEIKRAVNEAHITRDDVDAACGWPGLCRFDRLLALHTMSMKEFLEWAELLKMDVLVSLVPRGKS